MAKGKVITLAQLKSIIDKSDKPAADKEKFKKRADAIYNGRRDVYCVSVKKKVPLESRIQARSVPMGRGRIALAISGYNKKCKSKATGKETQIFSMITNVPVGMARARRRTPSKPRRKSKRKSRSRR